jgi:hypothetical protein
LRVLVEETNELVFVDSLALLGFVHGSYFGHFEVEGTGN